VEATRLALLLPAAALSNLENVYNSGISCHQPRVLPNAAWRGIDVRLIGPKVQSLQRRGEHEVQLQVQFFGGLFQDTKKHLIDCRAFQKELVQGDVFVRAWTQSGSIIGVCKGQRGEENWQLGYLNWKREGTDLEGIEGTIQLAQMIEFKVTNINGILLKGAIWNHDFVKSSSWQFSVSF